MAATEPLATTDAAERAGFAALVTPYSARIHAAAVDPKQDLISERKKRSFDAEALSALLYGGVERLKQQREVCKIVSTDVRLAKESSPSREERIARAHHFQTLVPEIVGEHGLDYEGGKTLQQFIAEPCAFDLHWGMFVPTVRAQGTLEQQAEVSSTPNALQPLTLMRGEWQLYSETERYVHAQRL
eukprot:5902161-Prymnesium_polylepis.1